MNSCICCGDSKKIALIDDEVLCKQCDGWLVNRKTKGRIRFATARDRYQYIGRMLEMALRKLGTTDWRKKEIVELGPNLRSAIPNSERTFCKLEARIAHAKSRAGNPRIDSFS